MASTWRFTGRRPIRVAARVADDDPAEASQERTEQDEAGPHLGRGFERDEEPVHVARGDLVDVALRVVHRHADVAQNLGQGRGRLRSPGRW